MAICRQCGATITFRETPSGKLQPVDPTTGVVHFATCAVRKPPPAPDDQCHVCGSHNVERRAGTAMHYAGLSCLDCGQFRWLRRPEHRNPFGIS